MSRRLHESEPSYIDKGLLNVETEAAIKDEIYNLIGKTYSKDELRVITLRWGLADGQERTQKEVAKKMKISVYRVRKLERSGMKKLTQPTGVGTSIGLEDRSQ